MGLLWASVGLASVTRGLGWLLAWGCWGPEGLWWAAGLDWAWGLCFWAMGLCFSEVGAEWGPLPSVRGRYKCTDQGGNKVMQDEAGYASYSLFVFYVFGYFLTFLTH